MWIFILSQAKNIKNSSLSSSSQSSLSRFMASSSFSSSTPAVAVAGMDEDFDNSVNLTDLSTSEADAVIERSFKELKAHEALEHFKFPPEKIIGPESKWNFKGILKVFYLANDIFGGRYLKVRRLGSGRPFLVEIQNARQVATGNFIKELEAKINGMENKLVRVKNLKELGSQGWDLMREGESEKQKQYAEVVWISRQLEDADIQTLSSLKEMQILQKTPVRVLHRRSPLERERIIHWMKIERVAGSSQYFLLHLCTQAGTYIKEFVHGDFGRTELSIGSNLDCRAEILQLDVTDVKMDCFLTE